jgi:hypothetical protein
MKLVHTFFGYQDQREWLLTFGLGIIILQGVSRRKCLAGVNIMVWFCSLPIPNLDRLAPRTKNVANRLCLWYNVAEWIQSVEFRRLYKCSLKLTLDDEWMGKMARINQTQILLRTVWPEMPYRCSALGFRLCIRIFSHNHCHQVSGHYRRLFKSVLNPTIVP